MGLSRQDKEAIVADVSARLETAQVLVMAEYRGLSVAAMTVLRVHARAQGIYLRVLKNTLVRKAVAQGAFEVLAANMVGPIVYGIGHDLVAVAKLFSEFSKKYDSFVIKCGATPTTVLNPETIHVLSALPSRDRLLAQLLGVMQAPVAGFVRALADIPSRFVRVLVAVREQKKEQQKTAEVTAEVVLVE